MTAAIARQRCPNHSPDAAHLGPGWELKVRGRVVVRVMPVLHGWRVTNHLISTTRVMATKREAEVLADRIARLAAAP